MYNILKNVISTKRYELKDILGKIDTLWVQGSITEEQRTSLISDAQNNARTENSIDVLNKLYELERRVAELEKLNQTDVPTEGENEAVTYPPYEAGKWYHNGDVVSFEGSNYTCIAPDVAVCVWSPTEYPAYWELVTEGESTEEKTEVEADEPQPEDETIVEDSVETE